MNLCRLDSTADTCFTSWLGRTYSVVDTGGACNSLKIARAPNLFTIHVGDDSRSCINMPFSTSQIHTFAFVIIASFNSRQLHFFWSSTYALVNFIPLHPRASPHPKWGFDITSCPHPCTVAWLRWVLVGDRPNQSVPVPYQLRYSPYVASYS